MTTAVKHIAAEIRGLQEEEFDEFLSWLTDFETSHSDEWDEQIKQDSQQGGKLDSILNKVRSDISSGKTKGLDEVIDNS